ncbi:hypothetical protein [Halosimplex halophilum]|uniref:hypothetical protein n=1 Tax=Halosimplex halophilum TaxID=2559572 RepID=UPI00107F02C8|nr:hypothetical protein [Halosimplex halophilum]
MVDLRTDPDDAQDDSPGIVGDALARWHLWAIATVSALMVWYTVRNPSITPDGYVVFFGLAAVVVAVYGLHDMERTPDLV